jgi:glycerate 2-kinase
MTKDDLLSTYLRAIELCAPETLVREKVDASMPRNIVAIGKCAGALLDGVRAVHDVEHAFVAMPHGYRLPATTAEVWLGGHPHITSDSFAAGRALLDFVDRFDDILFLISGGGSACVEVPLAPFTEREVSEENARLIDSGASIAEINAARRKRSALKGGRLRSHVRGRAITLVYSDVSTGALRDVASGPTIDDSGEAILIADNRTLTRTAASLTGGSAVELDGQIECDVDEAAERLASAAGSLSRGQVLVAGGEPTVVVRGAGRGGRCSELAVRFAMRSRCAALFGSSDGLDGNSGVAGFLLPPRAGVGADPGWSERLAQSDSFPIAAQIGEPIMIAPAGNNLRDLFLVARD